jgi:hypothetical protein
VILKRTLDIWCKIPRGYIDLWSTVVPPVAPWSNQIPPTGLGALPAALAWVTPSHDKTPIVTQCVTLHAFTLAMAEQRMGLIIRLHCVNHALTLSVLALVVTPHHA